MRFSFIHDQRATFPVRVMCKMLDVSASGYYAWRGRSESMRTAANRQLIDEIRRVHGDSRGRYGSPRVHAALRAEGRQIGRNRVARLMHHHGTHTRQKRRFCRTTDSRHDFPLAPNLLGRRFGAGSCVAGGHYVCSDR
jgi:putative transposase